MVDVLPSSTTIPIHVLNAKIATIFPDATLVANRTLVAIQILVVVAVEAVTILPMMAPSVSAVAVAITTICIAIEIVNKLVNI